MCATKGFRPSQLAWVTLHLEVGVAFAAAEAELLGIVPNESDALARIAGPRAEVACLYAHLRGVDLSQECAESQLWSQRKSSSQYRSGD